MGGFRPLHGGRRRGLRREPSIGGCLASSNPRASAAPGLARAAFHTPRGTRCTASRERLSAPVGELVERAKAAGALPPDFKPVDMAIIHAMLMAVMRGTEESGPNTWRSYFTTDAWRRYLELILDGLSSQARRSG